MLVDVPVQHNLPQQFLSSGVASKTNSLEVLPLFQGTETFANQELPGYGDDSLPGYEDNPLPTYNNDNVNSGNNDDLPSYKPEQQIYDPFTFQAENAPPTPASNRPPAPNQPPPNRQPVNRPPPNREPTVNIDNDVEFIDPLESLPGLPDFEAPVNANLNIRNRTRPSTGSVKARNENRPSTSHIVRKNSSRNKGRKSKKGTQSNCLVTKATKNKKGQRKARPLD